VTIVGELSARSDRLLVLRNTIATQPRRVAEADAAAARGQGEPGESGRLERELQAARVQVDELVAKMNGLKVARGQIEQEIARVYADHPDHFARLARAASERYLEAERAMRAAIEAAAAAWGEVTIAWGVVRRPDRDKVNPHLSAIPTIEFDGVRHAVVNLRRQPPYPPAEIPEDHLEAA
jgi:hypothetical protein